MIEAPTAQAIERAAQHLRAGGLVALPTETVYGLGADASQREAVAAIYSLKGRPPDHPLIVHVVDAAQAQRWGVLDARAQRLMDELWTAGLRPTQGKQSEGVTAAQGRHLEDMRAIAFAKLEVAKP